MNKKSKTRARVTVRPRIVENGKIYWARPYFLNLTNCVGGNPEYHPDDGQLLPGVCVFVHPAGRFATLAFRGRMGTIRECFRLGELYEKR